jgi:hypothetical protein
MKKIDTGLYKHYKGKLYFVVGVATRQETKEVMVLYYSAADTNPTMLTRPLSEFNEVVEHDGVSCLRFTKVTQELKEE